LYEGIEKSRAQERIKEADQRRAASVPQSVAFLPPSASYGRKSPAGEHRFPPAFRTSIDMLCGKGNNGCI